MAELSNFLLIDIFKSIVAIDKQFDFDDFEFSNFHLIFHEFFQIFPVVFEL